MIPEVMGKVVALANDFAGYPVNSQFKVVGGTFNPLMPGNTYGALTLRPHPGKPSEEFTVTKAVDDDGNPFRVSIVASETVGG